MYVGRFLLAGRSSEGEPYAAYRVSSRSFPNRKVVETDAGVSVVPEEGHETDVFDNPYIGYNCIRVAGDKLVATNGSHTDPAAEKIAMGYPAREALALSLLSLDFEKDDYDTPRIAATASRDAIFLGIARRDAVLVREFEAEPGEAMLVATYEKNDLPGEVYGLDVSGPGEAADALFDEVEFEHPVCGAAGMLVYGEWETALRNP